MAEKWLVRNQDVQIICKTSKSYSIKEICKWNINQYCEKSFASTRKIIKCDVPFRVCKDCFLTIAKYLWMDTKSGSIENEDPKTEERRLWKRRPTTKMKTHCENEDPQLKSSKNPLTDQTFPFHCSSAWNVLSFFVYNTIITRNWLYLSSKNLSIYKKPVARISTHDPAKQNSTHAYHAYSS